ncbi:hypothetical protein NPJ82_02690 [Sphingomonas sp. NY01]|uniref:hypothetical protein n=1 Tax=Sphingomonas sp. NY01 TaxID=2968057 RepID=UPI00315C6D61
MMQGFSELPADAQIDPIPEGFEELPVDAQLQPAERMDAPAIRQQLQTLIGSNRPRAEIDQFLTSQGIDPTTVTGLDEALAAARQGRAFGVNTVNETPQASPAGETVGQALYRGVGDLAAGVGDILGIVGNPLNAGINALTGSNLSTDLGQTLRDLTGAPEAVTDTEKLLSAAGRGGAAGLAGAGLGALAGGAAGMTGYVGRTVAANPAVDLVSGLAGGAGADVGNDVAGTAGAVAGGLAGGAAGALAASRAFATRVPASIAVGQDGRLTPEAYDMALRAGAREEDVLNSYARARTAGDRRLPAERQAAREAVRNRPQETPEQIAALDNIALEPAAPAAVPNLAARNEALVEGITERLPTDDLAVPTTPRQRYDEAQSEGIRLTRGQSEQDFEIQNDENSLRVSATREGEEARQFFRQQQEAIQGAVARFREGFGPDAGNAADRGAQVKEAVRALRDSGQQGVSRLYRLAEEAGGESLTLNGEGIRNAATDVLLDELVPAGVKKSIEQQLARYGLIGKPEPTNEVGITRVALDDGSTVSFRGKPTQLTAANAEDLRQAINRLYLSDPSRASQAIKPAIDDALEEALERATGGEGAIGQRYEAARAAHRQQRQTFKAKDIVENLIAVKKGTETDVLLPERAIGQVIGAGKDGITNLRKVRALLMGSNTPTSNQAWAAIQHQAIADVFDSAISRNVNYGGGQLGDVVSGAKLNSAIDKFGVDKLRILLDREDFNGLMKLRRIVGNATIPISGTVNPSGTATKIINYLKAGTLRFAGAGIGILTHGNPIATIAAHAAGNALGKGKEIAATRRTLDGILKYDGTRAGARRIDQQAQAFVRQFVDSGTSGSLVPTSISMTPKPQEQRR